MRRCRLPVTEQSDALAETQKLAAVSAQPPAEQVSIVRKTVRYFKGLATDLTDLPDTAIKLAETAAKIALLFGV